MSNILGVIPARYASTRFPGKPLVNIGGKSMVQRVYQQAQQCPELAHVVVATDDERIFKHVQDFGGQVVLTSPNHPSGTDRVFEALQQQDQAYDYVVNIQGDEPFIQPEQITLLACLLEDSVQLATLVKEVHHDTELFNPNVVKVVMSRKGQALYFSRAAIPFQRGIEQAQWLQHHTYYKHIGLYGYSAQALEEITRLPPSGLETAESLEQLRWLENGYRIYATVTPYETHGIDTPQDLERIKQQMGL